MIARTRTGRVTILTRASVDDLGASASCGPALIYFITASSWVFTPLASLEFPAALRASR